MSALKNPQRHADLLNFQLKRAFSLGGAPAVRLCEGSFGVSRFQWRLVAELVEGGPMSQSALTRRVGLEKGRVSLTLAALIEKGLVARCEGTDDKRHAVVAATPSGFRLYRELFPQLAQINRRLMSVLTDEEAIRLEDYLRRLTEHAQKIYDEGGGVDVRAERRLGGSRRIKPAWSIEH